MKNRRLLYAAESQSQEVNIAPLIDIVFILLIFFIVTTVFVEETGVEIERPQAVSARNLEKNSILIAITDSGQVIYGGREIGVNGVRGTIQSLLKTEDMPVILQTDKSVSIDLYTRVHDAALLAGARNISLATHR